MIITDLAQGTLEWHAWRDKRITASDIPVILGESDFDTPLGIWSVKTKRTPPKESNFVMQRGTDTEPRIRALYALENDVDVPPVLAQHDIYEFIGASLDGYNAEFRDGAGLIAEIKYPGKEKHQMAVDGMVPECYRAQIQVQLACANAQYCHYISYNGESIAMVEVERDDDAFLQMLPKIIEFWGHITCDTPPAMTDRDFLTLDDEDSSAIFEEWKAAKLIMMQIEEMKDVAKADVAAAKQRLETARLRIQAKMKHPKIRCNGVKVTTVKRKTGATIDVRFEETA